MPVVRSARESAARSSPTSATFLTGAYLDDTRFEHDAEADDVRPPGRPQLRPVGAAVRRGRADRGPVSRLHAPGDAFDTDDAAVLEALATQVSVAIATARLIEELDGSRQEVARRADTERALRQIAARITALHDPATILEQAAAEAGALLDAEGATVDLLEPGRDRQRAPRRSRAGPGRGQRSGAHGPRDRGGGRHLGSGDLRGTTDRDRRLPHRRLVQPRAVPGRVHPGAGDPLGDGRSADRRRRPGRRDQRPCAAGRRLRDRTSSGSSERSPTSPPWP